MDHAASPPTTAAAPSSPPSEEREVARAAAGDLEAFEALYRRHVAHVHTLARRLLGLDRADDATQDVFVRAWTRLASLRGATSFGGWLHRLAVNLLLNERRALARRPEVAPPPSGSAEPAAPHATDFPGSPDSTGPDAAWRIDLETALAALPPRAREVLVLHDVEGWRHADIARAMDITEGTSKSQLHRARMLLRARLRDGDER